jgi:D-3-phosphoglycerate dehydrogenase / 2-oxoglutarate reductase
MKILVIGKLNPSGLEILGKHFELTIRPYLDGQDLIDTVPDYEVILMRVDQFITRQVIEAATKLRIIAVASIGLDHIDHEAAAERGIVVFNIPGGSSQSVAEYAIGSIINVMKKMTCANNDMKAGIYDRVKYAGQELEGKTIGIVGIGQIGMRVARLALAFGMKVLANDPYVRIVYDPNVWDGVTQSSRIEMVGLEELLRRSDVVTLHCPLNEETHHLISARELAMMQPHAYLINTARGPVVDEHALRDALLEGKIAGAAIDVIDREPTRGVPYETPLKEVDDSLCILSPHLGGVTRESQARIGVIVANRIMDEARKLGLWNG